MQLHGENTNTQTSISLRELDMDAPPAIGEGQEILVVEDGEMLRRQLATWLEHRGFQVVRADNADIAEIELKKHRFFAAFVDVNLDGSDGLAVVAAIDRSQPETYVVVMSIAEVIEARISEIHSRPSETCW